MEPKPTKLVAPSKFSACLNALGTYSTEQFVLRLSPRNHRLIDEITNGIYPLSELSFDTIQAFSTYLHETVHWWQHVGSTCGLVLSLQYPAQAHQNSTQLERAIEHVGLKKSLKKWAEDAARRGMTVAEPGLRAANIAVNNALDAEFYKIVTIIPETVSELLDDPYFETVGHCYWMAYGHAVGLLSSTVDRKWKHLPDAREWDDRFRELREAKVEGWARNEPFRISPLGLHALFEGQARMIQLQYLTVGLSNPPTLEELRKWGYFEKEYGQAFNAFLTILAAPWPKLVGDPLVALFLLIIDVAINPTAGFPLQIESYENFIFDVDPGIRFIRLSQAARSRPELFTKIIDYSREEYMEVATVLTEACEYDHPAIGLQAVIAWATDAPGVKKILQEMDTFRFEPENIVVRVLFSHFVKFCQDRLARPEFFCWPGAWMTGERADEKTQRLFLQHLSLFTDREDDDGIFPRMIPGKEEEALVETLSTFFANVVIYDITRQWILEDGPFRYDYRWLSQKHPVQEMSNFAKAGFQKLYGANPDDFDILAS